MNYTKTKKLVYIAMTGVIVFLIAKFTKFPIFAAAPFLKMDLGEVPLILVSVLFSPSISLAALFVKELLSFFLSGSNILGLAADFLVCGSFLMTFSLALRYKISLQTITASTAIGATIRMLVAIPVNLVVLWLQYRTNAAGVWAQMPYILLFNLIKTTLDGVCFFFLYPRLSYLRAPFKRNENK